jgi:hypothetical protein
MQKIYHIDLNPEEQAQLQKITAKAGCPQRVRKTKFYLISRQSEW